MAVSMPMPQTGAPGLSFAPTATQAAANPGGASSPIQDAIKILSLRLPTAVGAQGLAPSALLNSPGGGGLPGGMDLEALLRRLFGGGDQPVSHPGPVGAMPLGPSPTMPPPMTPGAPRIIPGNGAPAAMAPPTAPLLPMGLPPSQGVLGSLLPQG